VRNPPRLMPAVITPFGADGEIDTGAHAANVTALAGRGIEGFLVAGSTGEGPYLEPGERRLLTGWARSAAPDAFILCGVAAESTRVALSQAAEAEDGGADAVLVLTPTSLVRGRADRVEAFYAQVAGGSPLPVFLYSVPKVTGWELPAEVVAALHGEPGVAGMKDSGGRPARIPALIEGAPPGFVLYAGSTPALADSIAAGASGGITASAGYIPGLCLAVTKAPDPPAAREAQTVLTSVATAVEAHGIGGVKAAAALTGLSAGPTRAPLAMPSQAAVEEIGAVLRAAGVI
jgi:dihydrodipicolinate synthase/N-acetylneuraminate lyase